LGRAVAAFLFWTFDDCFSRLAMPPQGLGLFEKSIAGKWLDLLTQIAPGFLRVTFMFNPDTAPYIRSFFLPPFEASAQFLKLARNSSAGSWGC
jgi:hypothetical protein